MKTKLNKSNAIYLQKLSLIKNEIKCQTTEYPIEALTIRVENYLNETKNNQLEINDIALIKGYLEMLIYSFTEIRPPHLMGEIDQNFFIQFTDDGKDCKILRVLYLEKFTIENDNNDNASIKIILTANYNERAIVSNDFALIQCILELCKYDCDNLNSLFKMKICSHR